MTHVLRLRTMLPALALILGVTATAGWEPAVGATSNHPHYPRLSALHAEPDPVNGGRIVDTSGRQVLLRGANVNALVEYWKGTEFPTTFRFTAPDAVRMSSIGWNSVRLLVSWSRVEPQPGRYDEDYLDQVDAMVALLGRHGIYSIIDLHQDAWGATLAAGPGERCPPDESPALGWDGAPGWATLDPESTLGSRAARCAPFGIRELSPAVRTAFEAFWADQPGPGGVGIRTRYVRMVGALAARYARSSNVAGYDVMNEPNAFGSEQEAALADLYGQSLRAIRRAENERHGFSHLMFFEPSGLWSNTGQGAPPDFDHDSNVVYAPHIYTGGFTGGPISGEAFQVALDEARLFGGAPVLSGEWGAGPERAGPGGDPYFLDHQALQDDFRFGATLWTWRESCGDPHKVDDLRAGRIPTVWGEFDVDCRTNAVLGPRKDLIAQLSRAYPRAAPGRLTSTVYDPGTRRFTAAASAAPRDRRLVVFYPSTPARRSVTSTRLRRVRFVPAPGGATYITARTTGGSWTIDVQPRAA